MPLEESVALDISEAQSRIDDIGSALTSAAQSFATALDEATQVLSSIRVEQVDASAVTSSIDEAVAASDVSPTITADASGVTAGIDEAVTAAGTPQVPVEADAAGMASTIDEAVASVTPSPIEVPVDTGAITDSIDAALSDVDTSGLESNLTDVSHAATGAGDAAKGAAGDFSLIGPAAGFAAGEVGNLTDIVGQVTPAMAGAALATAGVVDAGKRLFEAALEQNTALARLKQTYGDLAVQIEHVNFGGINEDLDKLAVRTGANVDGLRNFAASFGTLGKSAGDNLPHIADVSQQIILLAERASVLNPNLGTADEIVQRLSTSLARGGRFLAAYGLSLSTAQINAEALRETGKSTTAELSIYEKEVAGATLATQQLGGALGTDINTGAQKAEVQLRALSAAFEETLKSAGAPLVQPLIDALKSLEPVLASVASLFGTTLGAALHLVGPLLAGLAAVLQPIAAAASAIPEPVIEAALAFVAFQRVGPILADIARAIADFVIASVRGFQTLGASAATSGAEVEAGTAAMAGSAERATGLGAAFGGLSLASLALAGAVFVAVSAAQAHSKELDNEKKAAEDAAAAIRSSSGDLKAAAANTDFLSAALKVVGESSSSFQGQLAQFGLTTADVADELSNVENRTTNFNHVLGEAVARGGEAAKAANLLEGEVSQLREQFAQGAHDALSNAVATGELSRATEVAAIRQHSLTDGTVDWIGVLEQLQPKLNQAARDAQLYGDATSKAADTDPVVAAQHRMSQSLAETGDSFERSLVSSGQFTQSQIDTANALNTNKDGTVDYSKALDALRPGLGGVAAASGTLIAGLDTTANKFALAKAQADLYKNEVDQLVTPTLDADTAQIKFRDDLAAMSDPFQKAVDAADAYAKATKEIVDSTLDAEGANLKLFDAIDNVNNTLAANKGAGDEKTKAGRDDQQAIIDLVKAYDTQIEAEIRSGASADVIKRVRQEEITNLQQLAGQFPALRGQIDQYIGVLGQANTKEQDSTAVSDAHHQKLIDLIKAGDDWIQTLIKTGAPQDAIDQARQDEINKLEGLKQQYPELGVIIDGYVTKLQTIPPTKDTTVSILNVIQSEADLANIHTAIDELHDKHVAITADTIEAQLAFDALTQRINDGTFAALVLAQQIAIVDAAFANSPFATNFSGQPGEPGFQGGRMAGGPIWPGTWDVGEAGPERLTITSLGLGFVEPKSSPLVSPVAPTPTIDYDRLASAIAKVRPVSVQVFEAVHPSATAAAIDLRLGQQVAL